MKKMLCLFLILWLPLFMQAAWAMNTNMALDNAYIQTAQAVEQADAHHCHQTKSAPQTHHSCSHCIYCALANASTAFAGIPHVNHLNLSQTSLASLTVSYTSISLPNACKPPIAI